MILTRRTNPTFANVIPLILLYRGYGFELPTDVVLADEDGNESM